MKNNLMKKLAMLDIIIILAVVIFPFDNFFDDYFIKYRDWAFYDLLFRDGFSFLASYHFNNQEKSFYIVNSFIYFFSAIIVITDLSIIFLQKYTKRLLVMQLIVSFISLIVLGHGINHWLISFLNSISMLFFGIFFCYFCILNLADDNEG